MARGTWDPDRKMREISIPLILNEEMNAGHCDAQNRIQTTTCTLDIDDLVCDKSSKGRSITIIAAMRGMSMMFPLNLMNGSAKMLQGYQSLCIMHVPGLKVTTHERCRHPK